MTALDMFDNFESESYRKNAFYKRPDFLKLAEFYGMDVSRAGQVLQRFTERTDAVTALVGRSYLSDEAKADYMHRYHDRTRAVRD